VTVDQVGGQVVVSWVAVGVHLLFPLTRKT
jgi:hypothetical protein